MAGKIWHRRGSHDVRDTCREIRSSLLICTTTDIFLPEIFWERKVSSLGDPWWADANLTHCWELFSPLLTGIWEDNVKAQAWNRTSFWLRGLLVHFHILSGQSVHILRRGMPLLGKQVHAEAFGKAKNAASALLEMHICNKQGAMNRLKKGRQFVGWTGRIIQWGMS